MKQAVLRSLLEDANIPDEVLIRALDTVLGRILDEGESVLEQSWKLAHHLTEFKLSGPLAFQGNRRLRVARFLSASKFLRDWCDPKLWADFGNADNASRLLLPQILPRPKTDVSGILVTKRQDYGWPEWVTLSEKIEGLDQSEIVNRLGIFADWVAPVSILLEYEIDSAWLQVPTALDAGLTPFFVSKSADPHEPSLAWNWHENAWGVPEYVHRSSVTLLNPRATLFHFSRAERRNMPFMDIGWLKSYSNPSDDEIELVVTRILRQVTSHAALEPFLQGKQDVFSLDPLEFEHFVAALFSRQGYRTTVTKAVRDGGFDVIAFRDEFNDRGVLIQAKKTRNAVGIRVIRELVGARFFAAQKFHDYLLVVATTGKFSSEARRAEQAEPTHLSLKDYAEILSELQKFATIGIKDILDSAIANRRAIGGLGDCRAPIGIGTPTAQRPSHTTGSTSHVSGDSAGQGGNR